LSNGKIKSVIVKENHVYKDWGLEDDCEIPKETDDNIIAISQLIIDSPEIKNGFSKPV
jgi:hypothetical protein